MCFYPGVFTHLLCYCPFTKYTHTHPHTHTHTPTPTHTHPHTHFIHSLLSNLTGDGLALSLSLQIIPTPSLECSFSSPKLFKSHQAFNECCRDVPFIKPSVMALTLLWSAPALEICSMFLAHACCGRGGREGYVCKCGGAHK